MVDTGDLKSPEGYLVWVRLPSPAPENMSSRSPFNSYSPYDCLAFLTQKKKMPSICGCGITAITSAFQADNVGSTPITRSNEENTPGV